MNDRSNRPSRVRTLAHRADLEDLVRDFLDMLPAPYFSPAVRLKTSRISGEGLSARRDIEAGEVLAMTTRCPRVDLQTVKIIEFLGYSVDCRVGWGEYLVHAPLPTSEGGYINHSCDPNAGMVDDGIWVAIREIKAGEEVTCDYGTFETTRDWSMICKCGAQNCRGTITCRDFRLPELRERLGSWFAPYLRRHLPNLTD